MKMGILAVLIFVTSGCSVPKLNISPTLGENKSYHCGIEDKRLWLRGIASIENFILAVERAEGLFDPPIPKTEEEKRY